MLEPPRELFEPESEFHLADYVKIFTDRWQLIVLVALLAVAGGVLSYLVTPKEYRATTTILIERRMSIPVQSAIEAAWENYYSMEFYPTQYRLLQSRGLAERTVQNLRLDQDGAFNPARAALAGDAEGGSAAADQAALAGLAGRLLGGLEVRPVGQTQMVEISYRSTNPDLAARIANGVAETYIDWGIENRSNLAGKTSVFLGAQIETLKQEIQDKENQALAYSKRADIVTLDTGGNVVLSRLQALNSDYTRAVSDRIGKGAALKELEIASPEIAAEILDDPIVVQLRGEVVSMERDYAAKLSTFKPEWPAMVELKSRIDQARRNLLPAAREALAKAREAARSEYQGALRREQALSSEINALKIENREVNSASIEYNNLRLEIDTRRQLLDEMLRKQSETDVSSRLQATRESNVRVVDRALVPGGPFRPSLRRNVTLSGGVGLMLGFGLVLLLHYMDRTIKTTEEVERQLGVPVLAVIPDVASGGKGYGLLGRYGYGYGYGYGGDAVEATAVRSKPRRQSMRT
ncbi:MAG TPA: GumC family protein [Thermoanaerobaculia bacterium]|nr:GumC family protein [Thermoanaerobaculia bacterium]